MKTAPREVSKPKTNKAVKEFTQTLPEGRNFSKIMNRFEASASRDAIRSDQIQSHFKTHLSGIVK